MFTSKALCLYKFLGVPTIIHIANLQVDEISYLGSDSAWKYIILNLSVSQKSDNLTRPLSTLLMSSETGSNTTTLRRHETVNKIQLPGARMKIYSLVLSLEKYHQTHRSTRN